MLLLSRLSDQEDETMTITAFLAAMPGVDYRLLQDVGLDADGNVVDKDGPRLRRRAINRRLVGAMLKLLSTHGTMPA